MNKSKATVEPRLCPVCGLDDPALHADGVLGEICACCGTEHGYDDYYSNIPKLREKWINIGCTWWSQSRPAPSEWNIGRQLNRLIK